MKQGTCPNCKIRFTWSQERPLLECVCPDCGTRLDRATKFSSLPVRQLGALGHRDPRQPRTIGYLRVSTAGQDLQKNKAEILSLANDRSLGHVEWREETVSGKVPWKKRALAGVIGELGAGDNLVVPELSRLGRSMLEIMEILSIATQEGIKIWAVKGNWQLGDGLQSKIIAMAFAMASEIERDLISQRTKEALRVRKAAGTKLGRPPGPGKSKLDEFETEIRAMLAHGTPQRFIARRYKVSATTVWNWMQKHRIKRPCR